MIGPAWTLLDLLLGGILLFLGAAALNTRRPRQAVILFIAFGLVAALVWARLRAPDVALAEAAIGAGMTGALLLAALRDLGPDSEQKQTSPAPAVWMNVLVTLSTGALALGFGWAVLSGLSAGDAQRLADDVAGEVANSGVDNPVTAVLLNFRAFDTLLELAVLLVAMLGIVALGPERSRYRAQGPVLRGLVGWLVPLLILTAGYLLWVGAKEPGGAFQAGALLAAAGVVLHLAGQGRAGLPQGVALRAMVVSGVAAFLAVGLITLFSEQAFLAYPTAQAGALILLIEVFATLAIAATLILSYLGGEPQSWHATESRTGQSNSNVANQEPQA